MALLKRKRSGLSDPMSVVTNFVNACNRHDAEGVSACLHPDFDSIQPMYPSRNFRGADQVRRNWQAIFDAEPGFRLTVLRSSAAGDTVWLELHGAGRDAEVAGVFVMGVQGDRIRWARIYSALVEDAPAATDEATSGQPAPLRQVPPIEDDADWGEGATAAVPAPAPPLQEDLIAPVVDIDGNGRKRRGRGRSRGEEAPEPAVAEPAPAKEAMPAVEAPEPAVEEAAAALSEVPEETPGEQSTPRGSPADSIDPETLVDLGHPAEAGPERATVEPDVIAEPGPPAVAGSDYEFKHSADEPTTDVADPTTDAATEEPLTEDPEADAGAALADPGVTVETMVEIDPGVVVEPEKPVDAGPEVFVEMSIPEGAVDPDPQTRVKVVVLEEAPEDMVPEATVAPGLIVTTPAPAEDRVPDVPAPGQPKRKKRKQR